MIDVDAPPECWACKVAGLMVERGATVDQLRAFFAAIFSPAP